MLFGQNVQTDKILDLINLKKEDISRFRDCGVDKKNLLIWILTRTGIKNVMGASNGHLELKSHFLHRVNEPHDPTYELIYFTIPTLADTSEIEHTRIPKLKEMFEQASWDVENGKLNEMTRKFMADLELQLKNAKPGQVFSLIEED